VHLLNIAFLVAGTNALVWTVIEPGVAIVASSLVTLRPLLRSLRIKGFSSYGGKGGYIYNIPSSHEAGNTRLGFGADKIQLADMELAHNKGVDADRSRSAY
jgi:hypothetical protein